MGHILLWKWSCIIMDWCLDHTKQTRHATRPYNRWIPVRHCATPGDIEDPKIMRSKKYAIRRRGTEILQTAISTLVQW